MKQISHFSFADDVVLTLDAAEETETILSELNIESK